MKQIKLINYTQSVKINLKNHYLLIKNYLIKILNLFNKSSMMSLNQIIVNKRDSSYLEVKLNKKICKRKEISFKKC
jgi:hypothetical protein